MYLRCSVIRAKVDKKLREYVYMKRVNTCCIYTNIKHILEKVVAVYVCPPSDFRAQPPPTARRSSAPFIGLLVQSRSLVRVRCCCGLETVCARAKFGFLDFTVENPRVSAKNEIQTSSAECVRVTERSHRVCAHFCEREKLLMSTKEEALFNDTINAPVG